jgi:diguanylate cyclase (GGDEF)-like protein
MSPKLFSSHGIKLALLGSAPAMQTRLSQTGVGIILMLLGLALVYWTALAVPLRLAPVRWWIAISLCGIVAVYWAIRSGWSMRFTDPSLTLQQMALAICCNVVGYALLGPARGAAFPNLILILMFGMFGLSGRSALFIGGFALLALGSVMGLMSHIDPGNYPPVIELAHFLMFAFLVPAVAFLSNRLNNIRRRLHQQKTALSSALEKIQLMAAHDELTGLLNRRQMQILLEQQAHRSQRSGQSFCLALIDLDHFKNINDQYGHAAGDMTLRAFADAARSSLRSDDSLARWGGEEFVLMQVDCTISSAGAALDRLRELVSGLSLPAGEASINFSFSAGLTEHRLGECVNQTLARADDLLYQAKAQGRNLVNVGMPIQGA